MDLKVEPFHPARIDELLPLVAAYQRFYGAVPDDARNRRHFTSLSPSEGKVFLLRDGAEAVGFATFYFTFSTVRADRLLLLNDLYVTESHRGKGAGRFLLLEVARWAGEQGYAKMEWQTAPDNLTAQRLYDRVGGQPETWIHYALDLTPRTRGFADTPQP